MAKTNSFTPFLVPQTSSGLLAGLCKPPIAALISRGYELEFFCLVLLCFAHLTAPQARTSTLGPSTAPWILAATLKPALCKRPSSVK